jgi:hypothetical protein
MSERSAGARLRLFAFSGAMLLLLAWPVFLIVRQERILSQGAEYRLRLRPIDPRDLFRGRYLDLYYDDITVRAEAPMLDGQLVFLPLERDSQGFIRFEEARLWPPDSGDYLRSQVYYAIDEEQVVIRVPENLRRYYLNEAMAPLAEEIYQRMTLGLEGGDTTAAAPAEAYARLRVRNGRALIERLYFDDRPLEDYLLEEKAATRRK